ncbi:MAG: cache domain-containing protein, partial [Armatimonadetes bacterium]|nr:cache domain-containing protein [Armatimonadota bacterium]
MATLRPANVRGWHGVLSARAATGRARMSMATKLVLSYVLIIAIATAAFSIAGTQLLGRVITSEAETAVRNHLNAAREIVLGRLRQVNDVVRLTAGRFYLREALSAGRIGQAADELTRIRRSERLDILSVTDRSGRVLLRTSNPASSGDSRGQDELVATAARRKEAVAAVAIMPAADLRKESPLLAERAAIRFVDTPRARLRGETAETAGMLLQAAAPVMDGGGEVLGIVYGGILLNKNPEIVDKIKHTVFQNVVYKGKDIGTSTIFLDDVRISTNVLNLDGTRAIGTRGAEDVYNRVVVEGRPWIGRAFVVNDWYITAYEPIHSLTGRIIGILYVGVLEQKYVDMRRQTVAMLLSITFAV